MYKTLKNGAIYARTLKRHTGTMRMISLILILLLNSFLAVSGYSQTTKTIDGKVTDTSGASLPGVSVKINGTSIGTSTDLDGYFTLAIPVNTKTITFSYIGLESQEVAIGNNKTINVTLSEKTVNVDEVVVVGYGTQKKSDITGSVAVVNVNDMKKQSNSNIGTLLQGLVAGVNVTTDGQPGADPTIRIRGFSTFGDSSPLYVIDGVPVGTSARDFSPNDIESMQVLKDASASAIYGSRAANGVIIITTKKGQQNSPLHVDYSGYFGVDNVSKTIPVLGSADYQAINNRSRINDNLPVWSANDPTSADYINNVNTNWQKSALKTGIRQDHNINFSGGGQNNTYNISLDYYDSKGTMVGVGPDYQRYTARATNTFETSIFKFSTTLGYVHSDQDGLNSTNQSSFFGSNPPIINTLLASIPTQKVYDSSTSTGYGSYNIDTQGEMYSLNIVAMNNILKQNTAVDRMTANGFAEADLGRLFGFKKNQTLKYKLNLSWDKTLVKDFNWVPAFDLTAFYTNTVAKLDEGYRNYKTALVENTLNYTGEFGKHKLDVLLGQTYQSDSYNTLTGHAEGFTTPYYMEIANGQTTTSSSYDSYHYLASYLGRVNYDYDNRYLLTGTVRRDGSSRFGPSYKFGLFPSVGFGWKINHEKFFTVDENTISELKLRGSWGELGNENIGDYQYLQSVNRNYVYNFSNQVIYGGSESSVVDTKIKWENKRMANLALDASFLNHAFDFTAEYYDSRSSDLLVGVPIPLSVGSLNTTPTVNAGVVENSGFEFTATYHNHKNPFKFDITANASTLANKVISLGNNGQPVYGAASITKEGGEVGRQFGYVYDGIIQSQSEIDALNAAAVAKNGAGAVYQSAATAPGDIKFKDLNGDGKITAEDRTDLGSSIPHFTYGFTFNATYKNFDFSLIASGVTKFLVTDAIYRELMHTSGGLNWDTDILNSWTPTHTNTNIPRVEYTDPNDNGRDSNRPGWLQNAAYLKISDISVGYTLPKKIFQQAFSSVRFYATCQNVYTFTGYKGFNPDFNTGYVWGPGYNGGSYPTPRTVMLGIKLSLK
jgi:TonB-linked SusC/RagA family outer membrane protein